MDGFEIDDKARAVIQAADAGDFRTKSWTVVLGIAGYIHIFPHKPVVASNLEEVGVLHTGPDALLSCTVKSPLRDAWKAERLHEGIHHLKGNLVNWMDFIETYAKGHRSNDGRSHGPQIPSIHLRVRQLFLSGPYPWLAPSCRSAFSAVEIINYIRPNQSGIKGLDGSSTLVAMP
jgi:hypothetical protein